ncbi:MAG TPA: tetratricopeptide repeat protein [Anaerolineales bacterium]|jgi:tetratricopeptide (TPR) repeat protein
MNKRRKPFNYFNIFMLLGAIAFVMYFGVVLGPSVQSNFLPTPTATRSPESFVTEAGQLFDQGKLPQAIQLYEQAVRAIPNDPAIYISLARAQVWAGKYVEAQTSAENALLLNPNNSTAHAVRGWALEAQRDYLASETAIKRALELDPNNALAHAYFSELLADEYLDGKGPFDAIDRMSEESKVALSLAPGLFEAHRARGYVYEATGNYEDAIREYEAAVAINKNIADVHISLGRNYRALGVYDKAVNSLTVANQLNPSDSTPLLLISRVYATVGEYAKAEQYAQQAVKTNPTETALRGNLGVMYYRNLKWPEAAAELNLVVNGGKDPDGVELKPLELVANAPRIAEYHFTYGLVLVRLNRCGEALPIFQKLLSVASNDEIAVFNANEGMRLCSEAAAGTPSADSGTPNPTQPGSPAENTTVTPTP